MEPDPGRRSPAKGPAKSQSQRLLRPKPKPLPTPVRKPGTPVSSRSRQNNWRDTKEVQPRSLIISSDVRAHVASARARLSDHERKEQQQYTVHVRARLASDEREAQRRRHAQHALQTQARLLARRSTALDKHKALANFANLDACGLPPGGHRGLRRADARDGAAGGWQRHE